MIFQKFPRFLHISRLAMASVEKNALATLRKKTGYTFANCKKALELHNNDIKLVRNVNKKVKYLSRYIFVGREMVK